MDTGVGEFIANIIQTLEKNGYPDKRVALPLEKMYDVAHEKGHNFNRVLDFLREQGIDHEKTTEKVIFFPVVTSVSNADGTSSDSAGGFDPAGMFPGGFDPSQFAGMNMQDLMAKAQELMQQMSPDQIAKMQEMVMNMSEEEKAKMMDMAKNFTEKK